MPTYLRRSYARLPMVRYGPRTGRTSAARVARASRLAYRQAVPRLWRTRLLQPKQGFPPTITVNLPYQQMLRVNPGIVSQTDYIFAPNQINDLDVTGGGAVAQPRAYDQWAVMYSEVRVNYVDIRIVAHQRAAHAIGLWAAMNGQVAALGADFRPAENLNCKFLGIAASGSQDIVAQFRFDPAHALGMSKAEYQADDGTKSSTGAAAAQAAYLHLLFQQLDVTTVLDIEFSIEMNVNATFLTRVNVAAS